MVFVMHDVEGFKQGRCTLLPVEIEEVGNVAGRRRRFDEAIHHFREAIRLADIFRANVVDSTLGSFVFEITGTSEKIDAFADLMRPLGLVELARTGVAALRRGATG